MGTYLLGQIVEAEWEGLWYHARITHVPDTSPIVYWYKVIFDDQIEQALARRFIRVPEATFSQQCVQDCAGLRSRAARPRDLAPSPNVRPHSKARANVSLLLFKRA